MLLQLLHHTQARHGPIDEKRFAVYQASGHKAPVTAVVAGITVIPEYEVLLRRNDGFGKRFMVPKLGFEIRLLDLASVYKHDAIEDLDQIAGNGNHAFDERLVRVSGVPEDHDVTSVDILEAVNKSIYEYPLLIHETRLHAGAFNFDGLDNEDDNENCGCHCEDDVPKPGLQF